MSTSASVTVETLDGEFLFRSENFALDNAPDAVPPHTGIDVSDPVFVKHTAETIRKQHFGRPLCVRLTIFGAQAVEEFYLVNLTVGPRCGFRLQRLELPKLAPADAVAL